MLYDRLNDMERDIRFREASSRAQYIHFKAKLLSDELEAYSGRQRKITTTRLMNQVCIQRTTCCVTQMVPYQVLNRMAWVIKRK